MDPSINFINFQGEICRFHNKKRFKEIKRKGEQKYRLARFLDGPEV